MNSARVWRVPPAAILHWREWDREFVLYHEQSGDTHRLNLAGATAIRLLLTAQMTTAEVAGRLAQTPGADSQTVSQAAIDDLLTRLSDLGLVESLHDHAADPATP
jgi:PqqD family protein of HPr-rel-A system